MIQQLVGEKLQEKRLMKSLVDILRSQLERICYDFFDFAYVDDPKVTELFCTIKETCFSLVMSFYTYLYKVSFFSIREMDNLNDILEHNQALANIDTYKILQVDAALEIVERTGQLLDRQYFFRPEFLHLRKEVVHHSLKHFYHLSESLHFHLHLPQRPASFKDQLETMKVKVVIPAPQNIQIINANKNRNFQEVPEKVFSQSQADPNAKMSLYEKAKRIFVVASQDVINKINKKVLIVLKFEKPNDTCGFFIVQLGSDSSLIIKELRACELQRLGAISSIENYNNTNLVDFIQIATTILPYSKEFKEDQLRIKSLQSLERENTDGLSYLMRQNTKGLGDQDIAEEVIEEEEEVHPDRDQFKNPIIHEKHVFLPKKPIKYGSSAGYVTAKALGSGLGVLIVDCLDEDMGWDEKFKNAGCYGLYVGVIGFISSRLPVVGLLIQEALLVYAVTITLSNKVVDKEEKMKNLGHLGVQITIGVGFTIAGSILIPLHFWGAFIGALVGGICIGIYSKCVIPAAMASLLDMIDELDRRITKEGLIKYSPKILDILKISDKFFESTKPKGCRGWSIILLLQDLNQDEWMTLALVCLVNETHYMFQILAGKRIHKINEKLKKDSENEKLREELKEIRVQWIDNDIRLFEWKVCRKYVVSRRLNVLKHYESVEEFVMGMLGNFKII